MNGQQSKGPNLFLFSIVAASVVTLMGILPPPTRALAQGGMSNPGCPVEWNFGLNPHYVGVGNMPHMGWSFYISSAVKKAGTDYEDWYSNNPSWAHAHYYLFPDPARTQYYGSGASRGYYEWRNNEMDARCEGLANGGFFLFPKKTYGSAPKWVSWPEQDDEQCDDVTVAGCEAEGGSSGSTYTPDQTNGGFGGGPSTEGNRYVCDIQYTYYTDTGEILSYHILSCYAATN